MCDTISGNVSSIPGPVDVAARAARNKGARRVMFWGFAVPMLPFAVWGVFGWWTIALVALAAALTAGGMAYMRFLMKRHVVITAPESLRAALPAPRPVRAVVLPRNLAITRKRRQALPAPAKVIEPTKVIRRQQVR